MVARSNAQHAMTATSQIRTLRDRSLPRAWSKGGVRGENGFVEKCSPEEQSPERIVKVRSQNAEQHQSSNEGDRGDR